MMDISNKNIKALIVCGFSVAIFCISFIISSNYSNFKYVYNEKIFKEKFSELEINYDKSMDTRSLDQKLRNSGLKDYMTTYSLNTVNISDVEYANKVVGISKGFDVDKYFNIEWIENKEDIHKNKDVAIIGETFKKALEKEGSLDFIEIEGREYKVIGVIKDSEYLSFTSLVPFETLEVYDRAVGKFNFLIPKASTLNIGEFNYNVYDVESKGIVEFLLEKSMSIQESIIDIILGVVTVLIFSVFYVYVNKRDFAIMRLVGAKPKDILYQNIKLLTPIYCISFIIGILISKIVISYIIKHFDNMFYEVDLVNMGLTFIVGILLTAVTAWVCMRKVLKFKILEDIK